MDKQHLHFVSFDVPYPPDYGGIIDVFYQLKALHDLGVNITLHCFYYTGNNPPNKKLEQFCSSINYYHRKKHVGKLLASKLPFIVATRNDSNLLKNLLLDKSPILFSGLQTCYFLNHPALKDRRKIVRAHNVEHDYYKGLALGENNLVKKQYYLWEAKKLEKFEQILKDASGILSISKKDINHFKKYTKTWHVPPFYNNQVIAYNAQNVAVPYGFFHGNLSVIENINAVLFILREIAPKTKFPIIIAGKNPAKIIVDKINLLANVSLQANPNAKEMEALMTAAQVHLLFTDQQTGIKLKLMHSLAKGKHIIINSKMDDEGLFKGLCQVIDNPKEIKQTFEKLMVTPFTIKDYEKRKENFTRVFNNQKGAALTVASLFD
ncbi:glycosyltransferase family 1 protein [Putridiphycobacter roseus]|uniref:Glycosyltransferase family 1 protein n=1 Tax=Putridiphycobacter roseus TaxID=2219161 RepID=A0A2W1N4X2_9FLAO|nr:glycosyltransferase family 1 protein [Putridiphycobacter roseus]PZE18864.1 glycosyltransferase family 1 protein [Putridiphycobacter roseus]